MQIRLAGLLVTFTLIMAVMVLRPGGQSLTYSAAVDTETPTQTQTNTPVNTATNTSTPTATSTPAPPTGPAINFPLSQCVGTFPTPSAANVTFSWSGFTNVSQVYLDLSLFDNNFQDNTYNTAVLPADATSFTWNALIAGQAYFWRVTGQGLNGEWVSSNFARFVPCGVTRLLGLTYSCTGGGRATVTFRWAPSSSPGFFQFLDLTLFDNGFAPGTFLGAGPLPATQQAVIWPGILANTIHFFRVNNFSIFGWQASQTGGFVAQC